MLNPTFRHMTHALDLELAEAERRLATLPLVTVADPQTTTASSRIVWASAGETSDTAWRAACRALPL
jgi:hypothetical protein